jgi:hypothetical protein
MEGFSLEAALECTGYQSRTLSTAERKMLYSAFLDEARRIAENLAEQQPASDQHIDQELEALKFFSVPVASVSK